MYKSRRALKRSAPRRSLAKLSRPASATDEMLHLIFHEVRTPLSSIYGYLSILLSGEIGALSPQQQEITERMRELARYLTALITNLRQLALVSNELTMIPWEPLDLAALIRTVCRNLSTEAKRKGVRLTTQLSSRLPRIWAERDGLTQILINLLVNAIKFTPTRGRVTVAVHNSDHAMRLTVRDTGVGIQASTIPRLFKEFYHEDKPEVGAVGGTGFGLVIVKRIAERHGGSVKVTSRVGRGSTFHVTLPRRNGAQVIKTILGQLIEQAQQNQEPFTLLLLKAGGVAPDRVERVIKESIRAEDYYYPLEQARLVAVLVRTNLQGGQMTAERIAQRVERELTLRHDPTLKAYLGLAVYPTHGKDAARLLRVANEQIIELPRTTAAAVAKA